MTREMRLKVGKTHLLVKAEQGNGGGWEISVAQKTNMATWETVGFTIVNRDDVDRTFGSYCRKALGRAGMIP